jgi:hypothetical protein
MEGKKKKEKKKKKRRKVKNSLGFRMKIRKVRKGNAWMQKRDMTLHI